MYTAQNFWFVIGIVNMWGMCWAVFLSQDVSGKVKRKNVLVLEFCFNQVFIFCSWYLMQDSRERSPAYQQLLSRLKYFPVFSRLPSQASFRIQKTGKTAFWNVQWVILNLRFLYIHTLIGIILILVA